MTNIKRAFKLVIPDHWDNTKKGNFFEDFIADLLRKRGWHTKKRLRFIGMEIDILAYDSDFPNEKILVECKFSSKNEHIEKTDKQTTIGAGVITDLIGKAVLRDINKVLLVYNYNLGKDANTLIEKEREKIKKGKRRKVYLNCWDSSNIADILMESENLKIPDVEPIHKKGGIIENITLIKTEYYLFWVAEEVTDKGIPENIIIYPAKPDYHFDIERIKSIVQPLWKGFNIVDGSKTLGRNNLLNMEYSNILNLNENISSILVASSFYDQLPCRSEDFIGRSHLQKKFWDFLKNIRDNKENLRIFCFTGKSGVGKSSLVVKLTNDSRINEQYNKSFYIYNVDVRSAREESGAIFVLSAIQKALPTAIDTGFVNLPHHKIIIDSINNPLSSNSVQSVLNQLSIDNKILVILFDQFENILIQPAFFSIYEAFQRLVYDITAINRNIVLGFSWRTGILIPDDNRAYRMWENLKYLSKEFEELKEFDENESKQYIDIFASYCQEISQESKDWILNNCSGYPWVMNKICSFLNSRLNSQLNYLYSDINTLIKEMFQQDLDDIQNLTLEYKCLKYVAEKSIVSSEILNAEFDKQIILYLQDKKFLIKTGINYAIYWDVFKDFIINQDSLPNIPSKYKFVYPIHKAIEILKFCITSNNEVNNYQTIASALNENIDKVRRSVSDFQKVQLLHLDSERNISVDEKIKNLKNQDIEKLSDILSEKLKRHILIKKMFSRKSHREMTRKEFETLLEEVYPGLDSYEDYWSRMLPWFFFAGLLEKVRRDNTFNIVIPKGEGKHKGKIEECGLNLSKSVQGQQILEFPEFKSN